MFEAVEWNSAASISGLAFLARWVKCYFRVAEIVFGRCNQIWVVGQCPIAADKLHCSADHEFAGRFDKAA